MNNCSFIGRITKDIDLTTTNSGISVAKFSIAVDRKFKNEASEKVTDFFNIVVWRGLAENIAKYCHKGSKVFISGELQNRNWEADDGTKRYATEIIANECEFLDSKSKETDNENTTNETAPKEAKPVEDFSDKLPF